MTIIYNNHSTLEIKFLYLNKYNNTFKNMIIYFNPIEFKKINIKDIKYIIYNDNLFITKKISYEEKPRNNDVGGFDIDHFCRSTNSPNLDLIVRLTINCIKLNEKISSRILKISLLKGSVEKVFK